MPAKVSASKVSERNHLKKKRKTVNYASYTELVRMVEILCSHCLEAQTSFCYFLIRTCNHNSCTESKTAHFFYFPVYLLCRWAFFYFPVFIYYAYALFQFSCIMICGREKRMND